MPADTAPIRAEERFDEERVSAYLRDALGLSSEAPVEFEQFPGGKANLTYVARIGTDEHVLRRPPIGPVAPGSHDMAREYRVLSVLHQEYPLAPRAIHLCQDESIMGKPFFVMERRRGIVIRGTWPESLPDDPAGRRRVAESMIDALAALHQVDFEAIGLGDLGRPNGFVARQVAGWTDRWQRARGDDIPAMDELAVGLTHDIPAPQRATLLHNDFKLNNTMIGADGHLVAVFDWDMATTGDPLVDVGTTLAYWQGSPEFAWVEIPDGLVLQDALTPDEIVDRYCAATGLDGSRIDWYRALATFRIAVIVQQIYIRYVRGQTTDDRFAALGPMVEPMAQIGLGLLENARG
jgi:aminoglycoside phosphotransferase (APT) family kinase protein